jgi:hypothetical protein
MRAFKENRRSAIQNVIDSEPLAAYIRHMMAGRRSWTGTASDLLRAAEAFTENPPTMGWPRTPRALAGRLRRSQTFLRTIGIQIAFSREGHTGNRMMTITTAAVQEDAA